METSLIVVVPLLGRVRTHGAFWGVSTRSRSSRDTASLVTRRNKEPMELRVGSPQNLGLGACLPAPVPRHILPWSRCSWLCWSDTQAAKDPGFSVLRAHPVRTEEGEESQGRPPMALLTSLGPAVRQPAHPEGSSSGTEMTDLEPEWEGSAVTRQEGPFRGQGAVYLSPCVSLYTFTRERRGDRPPRIASLKSTFRTTKCFSVLILSGESTALTGFSGPAASGA